MNLFKKKPTFEYEDTSHETISGTSILVIDDEEYICDLIRTILEKEGCIVTTVNNGKEAMEKFSTAAYEVVITDMAMPKKDGIETIIEIRQLQPPVGIIAISGVPAQQQLLTLAKAFEADVTLQKPFTAKALVNSVRQAKKER